jgi:hypothetical protein
MLEILFLVRFVKHLSKLAKQKGRSGRWGSLGVALWLGGEITGFAIGAFAFDDLGGGAYLVALLCAAVGATVAYFVVKSLRAVDMPALEAVPQGGDAAALVPQAPPDLTNPYAPPRAQSGKNG